MRLLMNDFIFRLPPSLRPFLKHYPAIPHSVRVGTLSGIRLGMPCLAPTPLNVPVLYWRVLSSRVRFPVFNGEQSQLNPAPCSDWGMLMKRSGKSLNKEWKKKYVTLCDNGLLTYHPSLHVSLTHTPPPPVGHTLCVLIRTLRLFAHAGADEENISSNVSANYRSSVGTASCPDEALLQQAGRKPNHLHSLFPLSLYLSHHQNLLSHVLSPTAALLALLHLLPPVLIDSDLEELALYGSMVLLRVSALFMLHFSLSDRLCIHLSSSPPGSFLTNIQRQPGPVDTRIRPGSVGPRAADRRDRDESSLMQMETQLLWSICRGECVWRVYPAGRWLEGSPVACYGAGRTLGFERALCQESCQKEAGNPTDASFTAGYNSPADFIKRVSRAGFGPSPSEPDSGLFWCLVGLHPPQRGSRVLLTSASSSLLTLLLAASFLFLIRPDQTSSWRWQRRDYMQNVHGKEIDLLRTTVKVPGKRPPRAVSTCAAGPSPNTNGLMKEMSNMQLGQTSGSVSSSSSVSQMASGVSLVSFNSRGLEGMHQRSYSVSSADQWTDATVIANSGVSTGQPFRCRCESEVQTRSSARGPLSLSVELRVGAYHLSPIDPAVRALMRP
ncbi:hypothetical protein GOODEAATRI_000308 [Goodea atripinnis]|uniref:PH domain-containing protein n=1 Tax=Goodea atripinnis TaxID=208336 RepID=A0ABV0N6M4_9TELE